MFNKFFVKETDKVKDCLKKMQVNGQRCVIVIDQKKKLMGRFASS